MVAIFDVVVEEGAHWLVMEYVDGLTLSQVVQRKGPLTPDEAAPLVAQAADALVAAHAAGIAHRDVKPSNILVDRTWQVKLTDFGIARISTDATLTQTGMLTGSPAYLAPEVATGARSGEAADVWSLGATLFHLLAGHPPYEIGGHVLGALYRIVNEEPPRLDDAGWLAPLLEGTMVKDPAQRWSMTQVRDYLAGGGTQAPPAPAYAAGEPPETATRTLGTVTPEHVEVVPPVPPPPRPATPPAYAAPSSPRSPRRGNRKVLLIGAAVAMAAVLAVVLWAALSSRTPSNQGSAAGAGTGTSSTPKKAAKPTAAGMKTFIRDYVTAVGDDPDTSWKMLTPKFQRESGGLENYHRFWDAATNGQVLSIQANPDDLSVSYQVHFDDFDNGPGPTVLDLTFKDGTYKIDGERTKGFVPAG